MGGSATPTGLRAVAGSGIPLGRPRSENMDSPDGHLGGGLYSEDSRDWHLGLIISLEQLEMFLVETITFKLSEYRSLMKLIFSIKKICNHCCVLKVYPFEKNGSVIFHKETCIHFL